jgi:glycosyltransferase involved in cell wall biosynthesis
MHDMWELTGICHHALGCTHYIEECGHCLYLPGDSKNDLSSKVFKKKLKILSQAKSQVRFVAVSTWLKGLADQSPLTGRFPVEVIPNVIMLKRFHLLDKRDCLSLLHIKAPYVVTFGAYKIDAPIKGFDYLIDALNILLKSGKYTKHDIHLIVFGGMYKENRLKDIPVEYSYMGYVQEDSLSQIYSAADAVVSSSLYETFGQTLVEAMACGCLPVSFDNSGQTDIIDHLKNGYLAKYKSAESIAKGLDWAFHAGIDRKQIRLHAVQKFSSQNIVSKYIKLYNSLTNIEA